MRIYDEMKRQIELDGNAGKQAVCDTIAQLFESKEVKPDDFSIRELAEATIGSDWLKTLERSKRSGSRSLLESTFNVDTTVFSNITGQIVYNKVLEAYLHPSLLWNQLVDVIKTVFLNGERFAGIGGTGDVADEVAEGHPYPVVGVNEEYVDAPRAEKFGFIIPVTREAIIADRTAMLLKQVSDSTTKYMGINKEKRVLDLVFGVTNTYKRNGVATDTYLSSGAYINIKSTNALVDWTDIEQAELLFDAITDPNTGEPILATPDTIIVPSALKRTALRILSATELRYGDTTSATGAGQAIGSVRGGLPGEGPGLINNTYKVLSSAYVKNRTSSDSTWFIGEPKRAFGYRTVWDIETQQAPNNSEADFTQDVQMRFKVSEMGAPFVMNPRYMVKCTG